MQPHRLLNWLSGRGLPNILHQSETAKSIELAGRESSFERPRFYPVDSIIDGKSVLFLMAVYEKF
jgi:hypothetical protein